MNKFFNKKGVKKIILVFTLVFFSSHFTFSQSDTPCGAPTLTVGSSCAVTNAIGGLGFTRTAAGENVAAPSCFTWYASFPTFYQEDNWWSFVAPASGTVHIESFKGASGGYTKAAMGLYSGVCTGLTEIACIFTNSTTLHPSLNPTGLTPGATYYIRFMGEKSGTLAAIPYDICVWEPPTPPANDECINAIPAAVNPDQYCNLVTSGTISGATQSFESIYCNSNNNDDVWFSFVPLETTHYFSLENITGSTTDLWFSIHSPGFCGTTGVNALACKTTVNSLTVVNGLTIGATYYVRVWSTDFSAANSIFDLCIRSEPDQPLCGGNAPAGNTACTATPICNLDGYCGTTSGTYTSDSWTDLDNTFCGTIENNSFLSLIAVDTTLSFWVWVTSTTNGSGIQVMLFEAASCSSGTITSYTCWSPASVYNQATLIEATGLTIGNEYLIMIDGNSGDIANYEIVAHEGIQIPIDISTTLNDTDICIGESVDLYALGGTGDYTWSPATGLSSTTGDTVTSTPLLTGSITYSVTSPIINPLCPSTTDFITITIDPCTLPIELIDFNTQCGNGFATLRWTTASEINNDIFIIERSDDGVNFEIIGYKPGSGNSNSQQDYIFVDDSSLDGLTYYRLSQRDFDGTQVDLGIRPSEWPCSDGFNGLLVYPNPTKGDVSITFSHSNYNEYSIELYNDIGELAHPIMEEKVGDAGATVVKIKTEDFSEGIYFVRVIVGNRLYTKKFIKE